MINIKNINTKKSLLPLLAIIINLLLPSFVKATFITDSTTTKPISPTRHNALIANTPLSNKSDLIKLGKIEHIGRLTSLTTLVDRNEFMQDKKYIHNLMTNYNLPVIIMDTEVNGVYKFIDRIIQIAIMKFSFTEGNKVKIELINQYFNPGMVLMSRYAFKAHKLTSNFLQQYREFAHYYHDLKSVLENCIWVAHNAQFDHRQINEEVLRYLDHGAKIKVMTHCTLKKIREDRKQSTNDRSEGTIIVKEKDILGIGIENFRKLKTDAFRRRAVTHINRTIKNFVIKKAQQQNKEIKISTKTEFEKVIKSKAQEIAAHMDDYDVPDIDINLEISSMIDKAIDEIISMEQFFKISNDGKSSYSIFAYVKKTYNTPNALSSLSESLRLDKNNFCMTYFGSSIEETAQRIGVPKSRLLAHDAFFDIIMLEELISKYFETNTHQNNSPTALTIDIEQPSPQLQRTSRIVRKRDWERLLNEQVNEQETQTPTPKKRKLG